MKDKPLFWQGTKGRPQSLSYLGEVGGRNILYIEGGLASKDDAARIRDTWNACLGLDLPEDVPPGILKDLVFAAGDVVLASSAGDLDSLANAVQTVMDALEKLSAK